ncbi:hypothetical protein SAMN05880501_101786 [Ureibacillus xyleni]|uniref:Sigma-X negative effector n=1 Tax=Ureibacillus xyleni TaxID=614648 RepID=A0A285RJD8_9BACL|nr:hypothetical protein [Ureibacillus xyleni]SOB94220.1 hypothetical protein SAMN05880501_101786 [Ureibacillus xyleni]
MSHEKWDDDKIEQLLSNVPKIHDHRSKDDVLQRLEDEGVFDDEETNIIKKKKLNWIPFTISAAAIILFAVLVPSFMKELNQTSEVSEESLKIESTEDISKSEEEASELMDNRAMMTMDAVNLSTAVYPDELEGKTIFQLGLASDAADSVPVTVLIPNERIMEDFGKIKPTGVDLYNKYASLFNESAIGFAEYHPYVGEITEQKQQVVHTLPNNPPYDAGSAGPAMYEASLADSFGYYYEEAVLLDETGAPFVFSEVGMPSKALQLKQQYNYFRHTQADGSEYLTPNFRLTFGTVEEAILGMKEENNDIYQSVIIDGADFDLSVSGDIVIVTFTEQLDLMNYDQQDAMQMIEGILLTAANFNMQVQFNNLVQSEWQGFNFTQPLPMPVAANEISYDTVLQ